LTAGLFVQLLFNGLSIGAIYILMVLGLQVILTTTGIVNFAHGQFYALGAYTFWATYFVLGLNFVPAMLLTILAMLLLGALTQRSIFHFVQRQYRPDTPLSSKFLMSAMASVGLMMLLSRSILVFIGTETRGIPSIFPQMITVGDVRLAAERLSVIFISTLAAIGLYLFFYKTKLGKSMRAVSSDALASNLVGINSARIYLVSFSLGCALAGIAGALLAPIFSVSPLMGGDIIFMAMLVMVLGGVKSYKGGIMGGIAVGLALSFGYQFLGVISQTLVFVAVMVFLIFRPGGFSGEALD
jgi:branched-chain amino acid transport system permease protein